MAYSGSKAAHFNPIPSATKSGGKKIEKVRIGKVPLGVGGAIIFGVTI